MKNSKNPIQQDLFEPNAIVIKSFTEARPLITIKRKRSIKSPVMTRTECGRLGAIVLNSNPEKKKLASLKAAQTRKAKNPRAFKEMALKPRNKRS